MLRRSEDASAAYALTYRSYRSDKSHPSDALQFSSLCDLGPSLRLFFPHARRRRKSHVANANVNTAIMAICQVLFRISMGGMSFRKTPFITTMI
jgi:hypothetical protein